jgi:hypothetical protein
VEVDGDDAKVKYHFPVITPNEMRLPDPGDAWIY